MAIKQPERVAPDRDDIRGMSLRRKIDLIFLVLTLLVLGIFLSVEVQASRSSIREEMEASHRISTQLLGRIGAIYTARTMGSFAQFLEHTGRVRASEVRLVDATGVTLYRSPPPTYKAGRYAPHWYAELVAPRIGQTVLALDGGTLMITMNPSRAVLDSWDDLKTILISQGLLLAATDVLAFWLIGRWLSPLERILRGLRQMEAGQHYSRLPPLPGRETGAMGRAFNRMAQAVEENLQMRQASAQAQARLLAQRESTQILHARIEDERHALARELHDELGQSLTAIRSIAKSLLHNPQIQGSPAAQAIELLFDTAGTTSDAMHRMIPRLRPLQLEGIGLTDALRDMVSDLQLQHPQLQIALHVPQALPALPELLETGAFRIVQEALTNVVRHAQASRVTLVCTLQQAPVPTLAILISDNGIGVVTTLLRDGHYGVRGMQERAEALGGNVTFAAVPTGGLEVHIALPITMLPAPAGMTTDTRTAA